MLAEVRRLAASCATRDAFLRRVCLLLHERMPYYDWVGFYIADHARRELVLGPFAGEPTEHVRIPFGRGICGQVAESRTTLVVPDVTAADNYLACSLKVKSEIVVPVMVQGTFVAELDIDSHTPDAFQPADRALLEAVARIAAGMWA